MTLFLFIYLFLITLNRNSLVWFVVPELNGTGLENKRQEMTWAWDLSNSHQSLSFTHPLCAPSFNVASIWITANSSLAINVRSRRGNFGMPVVQEPRFGHRFKYVFFFFSLKPVSWLIWVFVFSLVHMAHGAGSGWKGCEDGEKERVRRWGLTLNELARDLHPSLTHSETGILGTCSHMVLCSLWLCSSNLYITVFP